MTGENKDLQFMDRCLELAQVAAENDEVPVGALVVDDATGEILAESPNRREQLQSPLGHAETIAIHQACRKRGSWRLTGCTLYSSLEPCVMCSGVIVQSRIGRVVYGADDPKGGGQSLFELLQNSQLNHRVELVQGLRSEAAKQQLQSFFRQRR